MRRALAVLFCAALSCTVAISAPVAQTEARKHCKHHRKHCRKKKKPTGSVTGNVGGTSGPTGRLLVTAKEISSSELQLQLSRPSLSPGSAIVEQYNAGSDPHNLILERAGQIAFAYPTLDPGGDQRQTVYLARGTYTLYCSLLNHRSLGMQATLTVN
jgi:plastocyanin